jgi:MoxR-like ATPase
MDIPASAPHAVSSPRQQIQDAIAAIGRVIRGKDDVIELAMTACIARGHILIEDIPGVGKSTLAKSIAAAIGGAFSRVQFTSDLLPADLIGTNMWKASIEKFEFKRGPLFANIVLADEVNRAPPRTQSALLEAMSEFQVSIDGQSLPLPRPFTVIATQNPLEHHGTYPLPESQKDRFIIRTQIGYADATTEAALLSGASAPDPRSISTVLPLETLGTAQARAQEVFVHEDVSMFVRRFVAATREHPAISIGVSTRGALAWVALARASAYLQGRDHVSVQSLQDLATPALAHRLAMMEPGAQSNIHLASELIRDLLATVAVPT